MTDQSAAGEKWDVQLRKGMLELVILAALRGRRLYGLEILTLLRSFDTMRITEGTLYPLLDRLKREGLLNAEWQQQGDTRPRKYYQLTTTGTEKLTDLTARWRKSVRDMERLLERPGPEATATRGQTDE